MVDGVDGVFEWELKPLSVQPVGVKTTMDGALGLIAVLEVHRILQLVVPVG